ncbi:MAG TPA: putative glycolipid-binding domain-containing protein [Ktedonobacterales bacterium]|jgi:hypothetical protein
MARDVLWAPWDALGLEHLRLEVGMETISADGAIIAVFGGEVFRASYQIVCDAAWRVRDVRVLASHPAALVLDFHSDGNGHWSNTSGAPLPALDGCVDVDFAATPFTNTLPIRRLDLQPEETAEVAVVYIDAPSLEVTPVRQRYTCLESGADGARYRFEALPYAALPEGFVAELSVDADGLVLDYPPLFRRIV